MDYEKAYKEALNRAKLLKYNPKKVLFECENIPVSDYIFPELKETEDEKIRNEIIKFLELPHPQFVSKRRHKDWIAWLESVEINPTEFDTRLQGTYQTPDEIIEECYQDNADRIIDIVTEHGKPSEWSKEDENKYSATEAIKEEKVDNANKAEPKFKVGDWVSVGGHTILISDIRNDLYEAIFTNGEHSVFDTNVLDKEGHLWGIADAMPGDIIYATSKFNTFDFIYIFSEIKNENSWAYCSVNSDCDDLDSGSRYWWFDNCKGSIELERYDFYPATKEQRDLLFQKMKEAGWECDAKNKELIKIE